MNPIEFAHITPIKYLPLIKGRNVHLVLAHLIESSEEYVNFYLEEKANNPNTVIICDNSAFELYKRGLPMYPSEKLLEMGRKIKADYIVMSDYPGEPGEKTIESAKKMAPILQNEGFKTFFVPQSEIGDVKGLVDCFRWAAGNKLCDYIGVSILSAPNAYGVERGNKLQRFNARLRLMYEMSQSPIFYEYKSAGQKVHFLGMVDGPNEIMFHSPFAKWIDTWDSSSAVWAGLNGISYDKSPTGLLDGKFEKEVDFDFSIQGSDDIEVQKAQDNMNYVDRLCYGYLWK